VFIFVVLGIIARAHGFSIWKFIKYIKEELLITLGTSSSESVLPRMMAKLENLGVKKSTVGLVVPTGYSFNLDGMHFPTALLGKSGSPLKSGFARQALPVFPVRLRRPACQHQRAQFRLRFVEASPSASLGIVSDGRKAHIKGEDTSTRNPKSTCCRRSKLANSTPAPKATAVANMRSSGCWRPLCHRTLRAGESSPQSSAMWLKFWDQNQVPLLRAFDPIWHSWAFIQTAETKIPAGQTFR
jgi:hypothetical protein